MATFNTVSSTAIDRCPIMSLAAEHYRLDGTCRCTTNPNKENPMAPTTSWRKYDSLETAISKVGGGVVDVLSRLTQDFGPDVAEHHGPIMEAAQVLQDRMRAAKQQAHDVVFNERGGRA